MRGVEVRIDVQGDEVVTWLREHHDGPISPLTAWRADERVRLVGADPVMGYATFAVWGDMDTERMIGMPAALADHALTIANLATGELLDRVDKLQVSVEIIR